MGVVEDNGMPVQVETGKRNLLDRLDALDAILINKGGMATRLLMDLPFDLVDGDYNLAVHSPSMDLILLYPQNKRDEIKEIRIYSNDLPEHKLSAVICDYKNKSLTFHYNKNRIRILRKRPKGV